MIMIVIIGFYYYYWGKREMGKKTVVQAARKIPGATGTVSGQGHSIEQLS